MRNHGSVKNSTDLMEAFESGNDEVGLDQCEILHYFPVDLFPACCMDFLLMRLRNERSILLSLTIRMHAMDDANPNALYVADKVSML